VVAQRIREKRSRKKRRENYLSNNPNHNKNNAEKLLDLR